MTDFIVSCVNDKIFPMPNIGGNQDFSLKIVEIKRFRENLISELDQLITKRTAMIQQSSNIEDPELESEILDYLRRSGSTTEYHIATELDIQSYHAYLICAKLFRENKLKQEKGGKWFVEK
jgi:predicted HTH transcriptional regulator